MSGLRSAELLTLQIGSVTGAAGERRIRVLGKGGKTRSVPIEDALDEVTPVELLASTAPGERRRAPEKRVTYCRVVNAPSGWVAKIGRALSTTQLAVPQERPSALHWTQQLAVRSGTGQAEISKFERGRKSPTLDTYTRLVMALDLDEDILATSRMPADVTA